MKEEGHEGKGIETETLLFYSIRLLSSGDPRDFETCSPVLRSQQFELAEKLALPPLKERKCFYDKSLAPVIPITEINDWLSISAAEDGGESN